MVTPRGRSPSGHLLPRLLFVQTCWRVIGPPSLTSGLNFPDCYSSPSHLLTAPSPWSEPLPRALPLGPPFPAALSLGRALRPRSRPRPQEGFLCPPTVVAPRGCFLTAVRSRGRLPRQAGKTALRATAHLPGRLEDSPSIPRDVQDASLGCRWAGLGPPPPSGAFLFIVKKNTGGESWVKRQRLESRIMRREPPRR